jgi:hydroxylamine dehydrogenase
VLKAVKGKEYVQFAQAIDFTWYEIWHHEGRRARHGAAMMAPDYTHWHGTYEVAKHWAAKYIPELKEVIEQGKHSENKEAVAAGEELEKLLTEVLNSDDHKWFIGKEDAADKEERAKRAEEFKAKYAK